MARKEQRVLITADGRDKGKTFVLHEMPSKQAEWWFIRLVIALANAGARLPEDTLFGGAAAFAEMQTTLRNSLIVAIRAIQGLDSRDVKSLLDEMSPFIKFQPTADAAVLPPEQTLFEGDACQIEEVSTWIKLRYDLVQLHVGFSLADVASTTGEPNAPQETTPA
jgi:hypothetical protein